MAASQKVYIIGIGDDGLDGLTGSAKQIIAQAEVLIGGERSLAAVPHDSAARVEIKGDLEQLVDEIESQPQRQIVILAVGDPLFYGTARFLCDRLGKDQRRLFRRYLDTDRYLRRA